MQFYSIWPAFVCVGVLLAVCCLPVMRFADPPTHPKGPRVSAIDGLRGFLAFGVFLHHAALSHDYWLTGRWLPPPSRFYGLLGQFGVSVFFMITAYLFWSKLLNEGGRPKWVQLYVGRVFRIGPVYWVAILWMLLLLFVKTRFVLHEPGLLVAKEAAGWLALGMVWPRKVNAYPATLDLVAGVTWTLFFEWVFYFSLIVTAFPVRRKWNDVLLTSGALIALTVYQLWRVHPFGVPWRISAAAEYFLIGMTCASLQKRGLRAQMPNWASSALVMLLTAAVFFAYQSINNVPGPALLLGAAFFLIISGCNVFGVLTTVPARRLGNVSYPVYLLQGLILTCVLSLRPVRTYFLASPVHHWVTVIGMAVLLLTASTIVHVLVEDPGVELGRRMNGIIARRT